MKNLLISTALITAPFAGSVSAQTTTSTLTNLVSEQERQIQELKTEVSSLRSQLNFERRKNGKETLPANTSYRSSKTHTVKSGDTFSSISKKYGVSVSSLISANPKVKPSSMKLDHKIIIPSSSSKPSTKPKKVSFASTSTKTISSASGTYKVVKGDTFYKIAREHGMSLANLSAANPGLNPSKLKIGQTVRLNKSASTPRTTSRPAKTKAVKTTQPTSRAYKPLPKVVKETVKPAPRVEPSQPKQVVTSVTPAPIPTPAPDPTASYVNQSGNIARTVPVSHEMTYGAFASQHGTSIKVLNTLNGLNLPADEPMAAGSELFIPIR